MDDTTKDKEPDMQNSKPVLRTAHKTSGKEIENQQEHQSNVLQFMDALDHLGVVERRIGPRE